MSPSRRSSRRTFKRPGTSTLPRFLSLGDAALTIELGEEIDDRTHARVIALTEAIGRRGWAGVLDVVPTYRSLTVHVDPLRLDLSTLTSRLRRLRVPDSDARACTSTRHTIPVLYGGEWGPDLADVAAWANLSIEETIGAHAAVEYRVYMLGFIPGFPYLGRVPGRLAMPRLATPRLVVPAGSVGIAEQQTGIYPAATPGGWRIVGRTPIPLVRRTSAHPFLFNPGDRVTLRPIGRGEFDHLRHEFDAQHD